MSERVGREQLLAMLLARTPDHVLDTLAALSPEDAADLAALRRDLADLALAPDPVAPPARLRARLLARPPRPRRPSRPVVVVLDMINDHLTPGVPLEVPRAREIVPALAARLAAARHDGVPVIYACDQHEEGDPDFAVWPVHALAGTTGAEVWPALAPEPGDRRVTKPTYSAFHRSDLGPTLEALGADAIVLTGCATELGLMATAVDALQRGYLVTVPPDCQAGTSAMAEQMALLTLATMPPYDPIYLRG
jgi:nicotinamidase-related amidase